MSAAEHLELRISSDPSALCDVRERVRGWVAQRGWEEHEIADIVLAIDEALTNVIRHGYGGKPGQPIDLRMMTVRRDDGTEGVEVRIRDYGQQVPLDKIAGRDLDDLRPGGLGVHIIRNVMDESQYRHADDGGTELIMRRYQGRACSEDDVGEEPGKS